jgi:hypothetical protein
MAFFTNILLICRALSGALWPDNEAMYAEVVQALKDEGFTPEVWLLLP